MDNLSKEVNFADLKEVYDKTPDELTSDEKKLVEAEMLKMYIASLSTKQLFKKGYASSYHAGYTKPPLEKRREMRRKKNKSARLARKINRK